MDEWSIGFKERSSLTRGSNFLQVQFNAKPKVEAQNSKFKTNSKSEFRELVCYPLGDFEWITSGLRTGGRLISCFNEGRAGFFKGGNFIGLLVCAERRIALTIWRFRMDNFGLADWRALDLLLQ